MTLGERAHRRDARLRIDRVGFLANRDRPTNRAKVAPYSRQRGHIRDAGCPPESPSSNAKGFGSPRETHLEPKADRCGSIADAPVTDWLDYDTCYTERYLGIPDRAKGTPAYDTNGLLPYAKDLTRPLLIIHGTADDNVHLSHSLRLADALLLAGKEFDFLPLAGETHGPRDPERLLRYYQRQFAFLRKNL